MDTRINNNGVNTFEYWNEDEKLPNGGQVIHSVVADSAFTRDGTLVFAQGDEYERPFVVLAIARGKWTHYRQIRTITDLEHQVKVQVDSILKQRAGE